MTAQSKASVRFLTVGAIFLPTSRSLGTAESLWSAPQHTFLSVTKPGTHNQSSDVLQASGLSKRSLLSAPPFARARYVTHHAPLHLACADDGAPLLEAGYD